MKGADMSLSQQQMAQAREQAQRVPRMKGTFRWRNELVGFGFVLPFLIAYALFLLWPVLLGLRMSLYNWNLAGGGTSAFLGLGTTKNSSRMPTSGVRSGTPSSSPCSARPFS